MTALLVALVLTQTPLAAPEPPQLTEAQRTAIGELARTTQAEAVRLQTSLAEKQRELAELYSRYELDATEVESLEAEILNLQRELLLNYRRLQLGLREQVGEDRFLLLKRRLDGMLRSKPSPESGPASAEPATKP